MLSTLNVVEEFHRLQAATAARTSRENQRLWNGIPKGSNFWKAFQEALPGFTDNITMGQYESAALASEYVQAVSLVQGTQTVDELQPRAFLTPTEVLDHGLTAAPATSTKLMQDGVDQTVANLVALNKIVRFSHTFVQDAGREATQVYTVATPTLTGYYRKLELPSCDRCTILAGKWFKANADFERHPGCDCGSIPAVERDKEEESALDPVEALRSGQVHGLSKADTRAILEDDADIYQVINAKRGGMRTADLYGERMKITSSSTTKRGVYHVPNSPRLRPQAIYKMAGDDKAKARQLLMEYGYLAS